MKIATGNDLATGDVVWWTGGGWSRHLAEAVDVGAGGEPLLAAEERARRVNAPYLVEADATPDGPIPAHIKDRVRGAGPTVRADLAIRPSLAIVKG